MYILYIMSTEYLAPCSWLFAIPCSLQPARSQPAGFSIFPLPFSPLHFHFPSSPLTHLLTTPPRSCMSQLAGLCHSSIPRPPPADTSPDIIFSHLLHTTLLLTRLPLSSYCSTTSSPHQQSFPYQCFCPICLHAIRREKH